MHIHSTNLITKLNCILFSTLSVIFLLTSCSSKKYPDALSNDEALESLSIADGYKIELFASDSFVFDPVTMEYDENGNCYVTLMPNAPFTPKPGEEAGEIRVLQDTDDDGVIDHSIVFADKLSEATSLLPWKGGLLVTAAPDILYLKDTNGDFRADIREKLFTGFFKNNYETQISNLQFSVDNWIYANNRGQEGEIINVQNPNDSSLDVKGGDFRFRLDRNLFENETGPGQFGQDIDFNGNRFFTENSIPLQQMLIPWRYTHRHPYLPSVKAIKNISNHDDTMYQVSEAPYWRAERTKKRNTEFREKKLSRVEYEKGKFTGCSGGTIYMGDQMPALYGNFFTAECAGNLVHRDVIVQNTDSSYFTAKRATGEMDHEFIYSKDPWFRPVSFANAPDGYFYMLDFHRQHIETPVSIPEELQTDMDFKKGSNMGRIYRIMPANATYKTVKPNLGKMTSAALIGLLEHKNDWYSITAHRMLVERQDKSVIPAATDMLLKSSSAKARLHALYVLEALDALNAEIVKKAMTDTDAGVRVHGAILAERFASVYPDLVSLSKDANAKVVLQSCLSLGQFNNTGNEQIFKDILTKYGYDKTFQMAVLSSHMGSTPSFLKALMQSKEFSNVKLIPNSFVKDLFYVNGARFNKAQIKSLLAMIADPGMQANKRAAEALKGLRSGIQYSPHLSKEQKDQFKQMEKLNDASYITAIQKNI